MKNKNLKKLNISEAEIRRAGISDKKCIRLVLSTIAQHFSKQGKAEVYDMLVRIAGDPGLFREDPVWSKVAGQVITLQTGSVKEPCHKPGKAGFRIFGEENIDQETLRQMENAMRLPIAVDGALMPDAHVGYGLPIGGVLATYNSVIPYGVGMDIGCRMALSVYPFSSAEIDKKRDRIRKILTLETRFGNSAFHNVGEHELFERDEFREIRFIKSLLPAFIEQLGSSGHGNHFVDAGEFFLEQSSPLLDIPPGRYLAFLSHSGSRHFGAEVCRHYTGIAQAKLGLKGEAGRLAWLELDKEEGEEYWRAMQLAGDYSRANHHFIHDRISRTLGEKPLLRIENHHNFAWKEELPGGGNLVIHRKGATPAGKGDLGVIPGTMASPAFIVEGKGNERSLNSAAHGAGRLISRNKALKTFSAKELKQYLDLKGVELIGGGVDEAPQVYKDIHQVMESQQEMVGIVALFYPKIVRME